MRIAFLLFTAALVSTPALADHAGPSAVGSGSGINVVGADTLDERQASAGFRMTFTRPDQRSDAELEALAGQGVHAHNTDYNLNAAIGLAYGISHHLTVSAELPYVRRDGLREAEAVNGTTELGDISGIGDMSVLAKYRLTHSDHAGFALIGGMKVPTGSTHKRSDDGERLETEHQPGSGSWDAIVGAGGGVRLGMLQLNGSILYQFAGKGAQNTRLGDRAQGGLSLSHRFGPAEHHHAEMEEDHHEHGGADRAQAHGHQTWDAFVELTGEWEGKQKVDGDVEEASGGTSVWMTPGARFNTAGGLSVAAAIGVPVWQDIRASHPNNDYRLTLSLGHGF